MSRIELIIKAIDKELISKDKNYLTLGQVNKSLYENGHITESEKQSGFLKQMLESGEIKNAEQTESKPKQWRIFLSDKRLKPKKIVQKKEPKAEYKPKVYNQPQPNENNNLWKWITGGIIVIIFIFSQFSNDDSSTSTEYRITNETYVATSKQNFDEMFIYIADRDTYALNLMILNGQVRILQKGLKVKLVDNHFLYSVIREQGSTQKYWIVTEHIGK